MGKRYRRRNRGDGEKLLIIGAVLLAIYLVVLIINFIMENVWVIYLVLGAVALFFAARTMYLIYLNNAYKKTEYYKETQLPISVLKKPGIRFESTVFNTLKDKYPNSKFILNGLFRKKDSINELFEVDILIFSNKGVFCLEIKDWSGMVYGDINARDWTVGNKESEQERVIKAYNPIIQNKNHIIQLNKHYKFDYQSYIVFSSRARIGDGYDIVGYLEDFVNYHESLPMSFEIDSIRECYETLIKEVDTRNDKNKEHIERINYNKSYYK